jgi:hypothetical protein
LAIDVAHGSPRRKPAFSHVASTARSTPEPLATPWCDFYRVNQPSGVAKGFPQAGSLLIAFLIIFELSIESSCKLLSLGATR